jgi:hypothetical protein
VFDRRQGRHRVVEETLAPRADDLARYVESRADEIILESCGRQQDDLRADDGSIR